jgi:outer membrane receptor protein involved in Fe transport
MLSFLCLGVSLQAQPLAIKGNPTLPINESKGTITGRMVDSESKLPLEFATISVLIPEDSAVITGAITDDFGHFEVDVEYGTYLLKMEFIAYETQFLPNINVDRQNRKRGIGIVGLTPKTELLEEIVVVAEKSEMQFNLDKRVFNVGKDLANKGGSAEDILDNIPSVAVDVEGNVSLRGKGNVRILVDGRPSGLIGVGDSGGLKSLPASMIEKVEVVTNAAARYDAEGTGGIINIVLKKDRKKGINGAIDLSAGVPHTYGAALNLNMRKEWINFFINYGFRSRQNPSTGYTYQEFFSSSAPVPYSEQLSDSKRGGISNSIRTGMDIFLSERDILTGALIYRYGNDFNDSRVNFYDYDRRGGNLQSITERVQDESEKEPNLEYDLTYERKFEEKGRKFITTLSVQDNRETEHADYTETFYDPFRNELGVTPLLQRSNIDEQSNELILQTDYAHPLGKNKKFEIGGKMSMRIIKNDYLVEELQENTWKNLTNISNNFNYDEDIIAVYGIFGNKIGKWSYQLGLRAEYSHVITELEESNEVNDREYANLFPSAFLNYELNKGNAFQISYSKRISRPRFWYLNPFFTYSNTRRLFGGNPNLDPEFTDSYELGYLRYWENATLGTSLYYRHTTGVIERISRSIGDGITQTIPENLSTENSVGLELTLSSDVNKWWRVDLSGNLFSSQTKGVLEDGTVLEAEALSLSNRLSSKMKFWKDAEFQIRFGYRAPTNTTQGKRRAMHSTDLAFSKDVLQKKGTITLSTRDIFNTRRYQSETLTETFYMDSEHRWSSRSVVLGFNYRINQKKQRSRGGNGGGGGEEMMF